MLLKTLSLVLAAALAATTPPAETPPKAGKNLPRMPIYNRSPIKLARPRSPVPTTSRPKMEAPHPATLLRWQSTTKSFKRDKYEAANSSTHMSLAPDTFAISYGSGNGTGTFHSDKLVFGSVSVAQDFGVVDPFPGLQRENDGLVGFGVPVQTKRTSFDRGVRNGEVVTGAYDADRFDGDLIWADPPTSRPSNQYWGLTVGEVTYGGATLAGSLDVHTLADTGTTLIHHFNDLVDKISGVTAHKGKIQLPLSSVKNLQPLMFMIKGKPLTLQPEQYMLTDDEVDFMGGNPNKAHSGSPRTMATMT
ncbi:hypothetical protein BGZ74_002236 [Mortierella antarctica]|nr:hypothetical protein BGZ74_002236 [Mortierella antarctica]